MIHPLIDFEDHQHISVVADKINHHCHPTSHCTLVPQLAFDGTIAIAVPCYI